jgi:formylglycine-generating enzyme required for sulfatase activity
VTAPDRLVATSLLAGACLFALGGGVGCDDDSGIPKVRLVIDIEGSVPGREAIDGVSVTLTASRTDGQPALALCEPATCLLPTGGGERLPLSVDFLRGASYDALALFRVVWRSGSVPVATREVAVPWPDSGTRYLRLTLQTPCLTFPCEAGTQCLVEGGEPQCVSVPFPGAFSDPSLVDEGVPCGRDDAPAACPELDGGPDGDADVPEDDGGDGTPDVPPSCEPLVGPCPEGMAWIPAGPFVRGSDTGEGRTDEEPEHLTELTGFCIDQTEVTNRRYLACMGGDACDEPDNGPYSNRRPDYLYSSAFGEYPVVNLLWSQAEAFCAWEGKRLPTEAEWEKACRGGCELGGVPTTCDELDEQTYPWGEESATCELANHNACLVWDGMDNDTDRVAIRPEGVQPSYCVFDLGGNVEEWVADWYAADSYATCAAEPDGCVDPQGPAATTERIVRGGGFFDAAPLLRCARRHQVAASERSPRIGFRCALTPTTP